MNKIKKICCISILGSLIAVVFTGFFSVWFVLHPWNSDVDYLKGEDVSISAFDGIILAAKKRYSEENTDQWALIVHSYRSHKSAMKVYEEHYYANGYNTLCVDNRAHGQSAGKYIGMGYLDSFDIASWIDYIVSENENAKIVIHGLSMGAASAMIYSGRDDVSENIICIIEDSGYVSADSYLRWKLKEEFGVPSFPVVNIADIAAKMMAGYAFSEASAIDAVKVSDVPVLFLHGTADRTVPIDDAYTLYNAAIAKKDICIFEDCGHGEAVYKFPDEYWEKVDSFIKKVSE